MRVRAVLFRPPPHPRRCNVPTRARRCVHCHLFVLEDESACICGCRTFNAEWLDDPKPAQIPPSADAMTHRILDVLRTVGGDDGLAMARDLAVISTLTEAQIIGKRTEDQTWAWLVYSLWKGRIRALDALMGKKE